MIKSPAPVAARNPYGPRADRMDVCYAMDEGSGNTLTNLASGRGADIAGANGTANGSQTWSTARAEGRSVIFGTAGAAAILGATGGDVTFPRGSFLSTFAFRGTPLDATTRPLVTSQAAGTTDGDLRILKAASAASLTYTIRAVGGTLHTLGHSSLTFGDGGTDFYLFTMFATHGEQGMNSWLYDHRLRTLTAGSVVAGAPYTYLGGFIKAAAASLSLSGRGATFGNYEVLHFAKWDMQLTTPGGASGPQLNRYVYDLIVDPFMPSRALPDPDTQILTNAIPICGRPTQTAATFTCLSAENIATTIEVGTKLGTNPLTLDSSNIILGASTASPFMPLEQTITHGFAPGTRVYRQHLWRVAGGTFYPFPGGVGEFVVQREATDATPYTALKKGDSHIANNADGSAPNINIGAGLDMILDDAGIVNGATGYGRRKYWANWRTDNDAYLTLSPDFIIVGNDMTMLDSLSIANSTDDIQPERFITFAQAINFHFLTWKLGAAFMVLGNHEGEAAGHQKMEAGAKAQQKPNTIIRKRGFPNPTNTTYPEGGENWSKDEWAGANVGTVYVDDELGENEPPLETDYAFTWGNTLWMMVDNWRLAGQGRSSVASIQTVHEFPLGVERKAWIEATLRNSTAARKMVVMHSLPGGIKGENADAPEQPYSRGAITCMDDSELYASYGTTEPVDQVWLRRTLRSNQVTCLSLAHDHRGAHVERYTLHAVTDPTAGAASHVLAGSTITMGWHDEYLRNSYGTAESRGRYDHAGASMRSKGVRALYNVIGYTLFEVNADFTYVKFRQTVISTRPATGNETDITKFSNPSMLERFASNLGLGEDASDTVDLADTLNASPVPVDVVAVFDDGVEYSDTEWTDTYLAENDQNDATVGLYDFDEAYAGGIVQLNSAIVGAVHPVYAGRWVYRAALANAIPEAGAARMGANLYMKSFALPDDDWMPLSDTPLILSGRIVASSTNTEPVLVRVNGGDEQSWPPGFEWEFHSVDLSTIEFKAVVDEEEVFVAAQTSEQRR